MIWTSSECFSVDAKRLVNFPLEDKYTVNVNEHNIARKSHDATQKNALTWCISKYHVIGLKQTHGIKNVILKAAKKFVGVTVHWEE